jgi:hypothetical protein
MKRLILLLFALACGGSATATASATTLSGVYAMTAVDGVALPDSKFCEVYPVGPTTPGQPNNYEVLALVGGTLTFDPAGTYSVVTNYEKRHKDGTFMLAATHTYTAMPYTRSGSQLMIHFDANSGAGSIASGDAALTTSQAWCQGVERFDFKRQ